MFHRKKKNIFLCSEIKNWCTSSKFFHSQSGDILKFNLEANVCIFRGSILFKNILNKYIIWVPSLELSPQHLNSITLRFRCLLQAHGILAELSYVLRHILIGWCWQMFIYPVTAQFDILIHFLFSGEQWCYFPKPIYNICRLQTTYTPK